MLETFVDCNISYTYREGNKVVDLLANMGCDNLDLDSMSSNLRIEDFTLLAELIDSEKVEDY